MSESQPQTQSERDRAEMQLRLQLEAEAEKRNPRPHRNKVRDEALSPEQAALREQRAADLRRLRTYRAFGPEMLLCLLSLVGPFFLVSPLTELFSLSDDASLFLVLAAFPFGMAMYYAIHARILPMLLRGNERRWRARFPFILKGYDEVLGHLLLKNNPRVVLRVTLAPGSEPPPADLFVQLTSQSRPIIRGLLSPAGEEGEGYQLHSEKLDLPLHDKKPTRYNGAPLREWMVYALKRVVLPLAKLRPVVRVDVSLSEDE